MGKRTITQKIMRFLSFAVLFLVVVPSLIFGVLVVTFDVSEHREAIAQTLGQKLGRTVKLAGPVKWALSLSDGFVLELSDVVIGNPDWATLPDMAHVSKLKLHVDLLPLAQRKLNIIAFDLDGAEIQLETSLNGKTNWSFASVGTASSDKKVTQEKDEAKTVSIHVQEARILNSHLGIKNDNGKMILFDVPRLTFKDIGKSVRVHFRGSLGSIETEIDLAGGSFAQLGKVPWSFNVQAAAGLAMIEASGTLGAKLKSIELDRLTLQSGDTKIAGQIDVLLGSGQPFIKGIFESKQIDLADLDFALAGDEPPEEEVAEESSGEEKGKKFFSRNLINFEGLKKADLHLAFHIEKLIYGPAVVHEVKGTLSLVAGVLRLSPFSVHLGGSTANGKLILDASKPVARLDLDFAAKGMELAKLLNLSGVEAVVSGKSDVDFSLTTSGRSAYGFASQANGHVNLLMDSGHVSPDALSSLAGELLSLFVPVVGTLANSGLNCLAGRYVINQGLVETKGLLVDTEMTTIAGSGTINLPDEYISMQFRTKPKGVGSVVPPVRLYGHLFSPKYTVDAEGAVRKIVGLFTQDAETDTDIPEIILVKGRNACAFALDHPQLVKKKKTKPKKLLLPSTGSINIDNIKDKVKDMGDTLKSLGGGLFIQ